MNQMVSDGKAVVLGVANQGGLENLTMSDHNGKVFASGQEQIAKINEAFQTRQQNVENIVK